nr:histidine kinase [Paenibacillus marchantiophytorum]
MGKALQAQINSHFLYNTLDLINWMAPKQMIQETRNVVQALAKLV